jgi:hypothetical protein
MAVTNDWINREFRVTSNGTDLIVAWTDADRSPTTRERHDLL